MISQKTLQKLQTTKNLLAFSAGGDSTALFFLLVENGVEFDMAIVDYGIRKQSKDEVIYAKELAKRYNKKCYTLQAQKIDSNFEAKARDIRYNFFEQLIKQHNYKTLLTAHHLGDRFEWFMMQFVKGAGCVELSGMSEFEQKQNYNLIRPLLHVDKSELLDYLHVKQIKYFEDETNKDTKYKRNEFRHNITKPLLDKYLDGIKKSFSYIDQDKDELVKKTNITILKDFALIKSTNNKRADIYHIDNYLKTQKHLLSANERELLKEQITVVVGRKFVVNFDKRGCIFISPYIKTTLTKEFKESCRKLKIDPKLRGFLFENQEVFKQIKDTIQKKLDR